MTSKDIQDEFFNVVRRDPLLDVRIANALEAEEGIEIGTRASLEGIKYCLEEYIKQTQEALSLLEQTVLVIPKSWLELSIEKYQEVLQQVERRLENGDYKE